MEKHAFCFLGRHVQSQVQYRPRHGRWQHARSLPLPSHPPLRALECRLRNKLPLLPAGGQCGGRDHMPDPIIRALEWILRDPAWHRDLEIPFLRVYETTFLPKILDYGNQARRHLDVPSSPFFGPRGEFWMHSWLTAERQFPPTTNKSLYGPAGGNNEASHTLRIMSRCFSILIVHPIPSALQFPDGEGSWFALGRYYIILRRTHLSLMLKLSYYMEFIVFTSIYLTAWWHLQCHAWNKK